MAIFYNDEIKIKVLNDFSANMGGGTLAIYAAPRPVSANDPAIGAAADPPDPEAPPVAKLLVEIENISWGQPEIVETLDEGTGEVISTEYVMDLDGFVTGVAVESGDAAWARLSNGNYIMDGSVSTSISSDFAIDAIKINIDSTVTLLHAKVSLS